MIGPVIRLRPPIPLSAPGSPMKLLRLALVAVVAVALSAPGVRAQEAPRVAHQPSSSLPFSAAIQVGDTYWFSGKIGASGETRAMDEGKAAAETRNILEAFDELFTQLGVGFEDVVKATVYLTSVDDYPAMNEVYREYFPEEGPAREAVIVADLVAGASVEISFVAVRR